MANDPQELFDAKSGLVKGQAELRQTAFELRQTLNEEDLHPVDWTSIEQTIFDPLQTAEGHEHAIADLKSLGDAAPRGALDTSAERSVSDSPGSLGPPGAEGSGERRDAATYNLLRHGTRSIGERGVGVRRL